MSTLEHAISIAALAHAGQVDKAGAPYILHPVRVMLRLTEPEDQIVAVLHDVVEDNRDWSLNRLRREKFSENVVNAVDALTRRPQEKYEDFIVRVAMNPIALRVKLADLLDNSDITRIKHPTENDHKRTNKYQRAIIELTKKMENMKRN